MRRAAVAMFVVLSCGVSGCESEKEHALAAKNKTLTKKLAVLQGALDGAQLQVKELSELAKGKEQLVVELNKRLEESSAASATLRKDLNTRDRELAELQNKIDVLNKKAAEKKHTANVAAKDVLSDLVIHYWRPSGDYDNWGVHVWGPAVETATFWNKPVMFDGKDQFGVFTKVKLNPIDAQKYPVKLVIHRDAEKDGPLDHVFMATKYHEIWMIQGVTQIYGTYQDAKLARDSVISIP